jgi:Icc-related predicted phosphoesterase
VKVWAISDLHLSYKENRALLLELPDFADDWLIVAGDIGEKLEYHRFAWQELSKHFAKIIWTPGNHDLWTMPHSTDGKGQHKYASLIKIAREYGVITPEDPFCKITIAEQTYCIVPLFTLYDYSFRPNDVPAAKALDWAHEARIYSNDENYLLSSPFSSVPNWARARFKIAEERLGALPPDLQLIVVTHYPLLSELCRLYRIPRYSIWCGSKITESWIKRYNISIAISGHMHMRATDYRLGVRFEEVSLGYPRDWRKGRPLKSYLRQILPADSSNITGATMWRP